MPGSARRVGRLHLTVATEADVYRGRVLVEDALRVASFPPMGGRLLVIRRLELGAVDLNRSSAALATVIEAATRGAVRQAVPHDDAGAATANAVYFSDAATAASSFIRRLVAGPRPTEWFWPRVVPGWEPTGSTAEGCLAGFHALLDDGGGGAGPERAVRLAVAVDALRRAGVLDAVLTILTRDDGAVLLARLGLRPSALNATLRASVPGAEAVSPALAEWTAPVAAWCTSWGAGDPRAQWLAVMAVLSALPHMATPAHLAARASRLLARATESLRPMRSRQTEERARVDEAVPEVQADGGGHTEALAANRRSAPRPDAMRRSHRTEVSPQGDWRGAPTGGPPTPGAASTAPPARRATRLHADEAWAATTAPEKGPGGPADPWWTLEPTVAAGLFFVLPLLTRLGIEDALAADPFLLEMPFASRLLEHIADRVAVPPDDAIRMAFRPPGDVDWKADLEALLQGWCTRVRRYCHRVAHIGLCTLVRRTGLVAATSTHVDVVLPLASVDIRIRRAGLDCDPGWVPWLGLVVRFHYGDEP